MNKCFSDVVRTENSLFFLFHQNKLLVGKISKSCDDIREIIPSNHELKNASICCNNLISIGTFANYQCYVAELTEIIYISDKYNFIPLRSLVGLMEDDLFLMAGRALHLLNWVKNNKYCGRCGNQMIYKSDEIAKACPNCGNIVYPRISPAIIVAVTKENKLLLAHNNNFRAGLFTVIAGFSEPGETLEQTVSREVFEETGLMITNIKYFGSQPWPFPDSLMIAFTAEYESGEICVDGTEIVEADWYNAENLPDIPSEGSIARKLIDTFVKNNLQEDV